MIIRPLSTSIATLLYPDTEVAPAGGASPAAAAAPAAPAKPSSPAPPPKPERAPAAAVRAKDSPTGSDIPKVSAPKAKTATVVQPTAEKKPAGIVDVKKAFGLSKPPSELNREEGDKLAARAAKNTTVIPAPKIKSKGVPLIEEEGGDAEPPEVKTELPEVDAAPKLKIKIGDKEEELTQEEIQARIAELTASTKKDPETKLPIGETKPEAKKEKTPEEIQADQAEEERKDAEFLEHLAQKNYAIDENELDAILAGGKKAVAAFSKHFAKAEYAARKFAADGVNQLYSQLQPIFEHFGLIDKYQNEAALVQEHPDITPHMQTYRDMEATLTAKYGKELAAMSPAERRGEIATHTRKFIKRYGIQAPAAAAEAAAAAPAAAAAAKPPKPKPPTGNVGGGRAPAAMSVQGAMVQKLLDRGL